MYPMPPHLTHCTPPVCPDRENCISLVPPWPVSFQTLTVLSLLAVARRLHCRFLCNGSQEISLIRSLCPWRMFPMRSNFFPCQIATFESRPPDANRSPFGDHEIDCTQAVCAFNTFTAVSVYRSQTRMVQSPDPVTNWLPSGEKEQTSTASLCPDKVEVQRVTGRTLNTACGRNMILSTSSVGTVSLTFSVSDFLNRLPFFSMLSAHASFCFFSSSSATFSVTSSSPIQYEYGCESSFPISLFSTSSS
mmetsp:Transcript_55286/g.91144  ORF Transcript_55286/g.91144 Transcript_55286/m.91144 type:complete len:248 (+) Transcript_55286:674-1417(+)